MISLNLGRALGVGTRLAAFALISLMAGAQHLAVAATWNGIEPLKSRRDDVERVLGKPVEALPDESGALHFKVAGGSVTVQFVDRKFAAAKRLPETAVGTVLQVVLQHEAAADTPESLKLAGNKDFEREERAGVSVYRNVRDGLFYTFINGKLKTTRYAASAEEIARAQKSRS